MKRTIIICLLFAILPVALISRNTKHNIDTIGIDMPPLRFEIPDTIERSFIESPLDLNLPDTLIFNPGDTIPNPLWRKFQTESLAGASINRIFNSPIDRMPVIVPPDYNFSIITVAPDSTYKYHLRNLHSGESLSETINIGHKY